MSDLRKASSDGIPPPDGSSPAGRPASHRRLFADFLFRRPEGFPRGPSTDKTPDLPIFSYADVNPSRAADACPPTRKTADKRLARRWTNVLRQNRRRGRRTAAWAKRAVLANGAAYALKSDGFFAKCIALHPLRFQSPRRFAGPQPPLYPQLRFRIRFRIRKHKKRRA